ncbi:phosphotransferase-like protein, partial [Vibrio parahaemolyticus]|uniref:phosphotransferase-like protein n=1 Tax=Vibrio parahaemolyticus TaxID=670 RepID=UPI003CC6C573
MRRLLYCVAHPLAGRYVLGGKISMDVIILNGASSSGKSSIAKELQSILPRNYLHIGIDTFISMMPEKSNSLDCSD